MNAGCEIRARSLLSSRLQSSAPPAPGSVRHDIWAEWPIVRRRRGADPGGMLFHALLLAGGLVPLAAMLAALFAAAWLRQSDSGQGKRDEELVRARLDR